MPIPKEKRNTNGFKQNPQNIRKGREKGEKNRSTIFKKWLETIILTENPITQKDEKLSVEELMNLQIIKNVLENGDLNSFKEIQDSVYGKIKDKIETENNTKIVLEQITGMEIK